MHPRTGAADVVPLVPIQPEDEPRAREAAVALADRVAQELELPVFFYAGLTEERGRPRTSAAAVPQSCSAASTRPS